MAAARKVQKFQIKNRRIKIDIYLILVFILLGALLIFSLLNWWAVIGLRQQVNELLINNSSQVKRSLTTNKVTTTSDNFLSSKVVAIASSVVRFLNWPSSQSGVASTTSPVNQNIFGDVALTVASVTPSLPEVIMPVVVVDNRQTYSEISPETFYNTIKIDQAGTTMYIDTQAGAAIFPPLLNFKKENACDDTSCSLRPQAEASCILERCLKVSDNNLLFNNEPLALPRELVGKTIKNLSVSSLSSKWIVGAVVSSGGTQEEAYVFIYDGSNFTKLIGGDTTPQIITVYGYGRGQISAGGSDDHFLILYSGYEAQALVYNRGVWQNITPYLDLRLANGGFKAKVMKSGVGNQTTWYVCSESKYKARVIKFWQNDSDQIQGVINLTDVFLPSRLRSASFICELKSNNKLAIAVTAKTQTDLYSLLDNGFENSVTQYYLSNNLNSLLNKSVFSANIYDFNLNAPRGYQIYLSADKNTWNEFKGNEGELEEGVSDQLFIKAEFSPGDNYYSPWLGTISLSYSAHDIEN